MMELAVVVLTLLSVWAVVVFIWMRRVNKAMDQVGEALKAQMMVNDHTRKEIEAVKDRTYTLEARREGLNVH